jgi:hypothetical protein
MVEDLLRRLLSCIEAEAGGSSRPVRERRRLLIEYWYTSLTHRYRDDPRALDPAWYAEVASLFMAYVEAYDRFFDRLEPTAVEPAVVWDIIAAVRETIWAVDEALAGYEAARDRGDQPAADHCIHRALGELFSWDDNRRIRAYVYVLTGEPLTNASAKTEKSRLLDVLEGCREQLSDAIDQLLE